MKLPNNGLAQVCATSAIYAGSGKVCESDSLRSLLSLQRIKAYVQDKPSALGLTYSSSAPGLQRLALQLDHYPTNGGDTDSLRCALTGRLLMMADSWAVDTPSWGRIYQNNEYG